MDSTLHDLRELLIKSIPTVIFFVFLTYYLSRVFFRPMALILEERRKATEGVCELAQRAMEAAGRRGDEFDAVIRAARADLQKEHESLRRQWTQEQAETLAKARANAEALIAIAKQQINGEVEKAQAELDTKVETLSQQIVESLLRRRAA